MHPLKEHSTNRSVDAAAPSSASACPHSPATKIAPFLGSLSPLESTLLRVFILNNLNRDYTFHAKTMVQSLDDNPSEMRGRIKVEAKYRLLRIKRNPLPLVLKVVIFALVVGVLYRYRHMYYPMSGITWLKVVGYGVIPLILAWAGDHFAADVVREAKKKLMYRVFFIAFALLGIAFIATVEKKIDDQHQFEIDAQNKQLDYQKERLEHMNTVLDNGQQSSVLFAQQFKDFRLDLRSMALASKNAASTSAINSTTANPTISSSDISRLEQRAQHAEEAALYLTKYYGEQSKIQNWPLGASGDGYPIALAKFFTFEFPETRDLNGQDRFFIYYLLKHNCEASLNIMFKDMEPLMEKEFPGITANPTMDSLLRLQRRGLLEQGLPAFGARLKTEYCLRFKGKEIP